MRATLLLACVSFAVMLTAIEIGARYWIAQIADEDQFTRYASLDQLRDRSENPDQPFSRYSSHRLLGFVPTSDFARGDDRHNSLGFRGEAVGIPKPPGEFRIVCIGGSTTYTSFVPDFRLAYPAQLESELHERGYRRVRVVNAGAAGYTTAESLANLQFRVLDLNPDMIVIYHGINDVINRAVWPPEAYRGDRSGYIRHSPGFDAAPPMIERSSVARMLLIRSGRIRPHLSFARTLGLQTPMARWLDYNIQVKTGRYPNGFFKRVSLMKILRKNPPVYFRRNLENMIFVARGNGIEPVLATFAYSTHDPDDSLATPPAVFGMNQHNRIVLDIGHELEVPVYDFAAEFPKDTSLFVGAVHLNKAGASLKGKLFADYLVRSRLIPTR